VLLSEKRCDQLCSAWSDEYLPTYKTSYDEHPGGIYVITSRSTGKLYVGLTQNFDRRKQSHLAHLRAGKHHCAKLQALFDDLGESDLFFDFRFPTSERGEALEKIEAQVMSKYPADKLLNTSIKDEMLRHTYDSRKVVKYSNGIIISGASEEELIKAHIIGPKTAIINS